MKPPEMARQIAALHELYCRLTGQKIRLAYDRERLWFEWIRAGFTADQLQQVIAYLQKQIRAQHRNVGALKLSNLLQPDRFEEDLNISRVHLRPPKPPPTNKPQPKVDPGHVQQGRAHATSFLRNLKDQLR